MKARLLIKDKNMKSRNKKGKKKKKTFAKNKNMTTLCNPYLWERDENITLLR